MAALSLQECPLQCEVTGERALVDGAKELRCEYLIIRPGPNFKCSPMRYREEGPCEVVMREV